MVEIHCTKTYLLVGRLSVFVAFLVYTEIVDDDVTTRGYGDSAAHPYGGHEQNYLLNRSSLMIRTSCTFVSYIKDNNYWFHAMLNYSYVFSWMLYHSES